MQSHSDHPTRVQSDRAFLIYVLLMFISILGAMFFFGFFTGKAVEHKRLDFDLKLKNTVIITKASDQA